MCLTCVITVICAVYITVCIICAFVCGLIRSGDDRDKICFLLHDLEDCTEAADYIADHCIDPSSVILVDCGIDPDFGEELRAVLPDCSIIVLQSAE